MDVKTKAVTVGFSAVAGGAVGYLCERHGVLAKLKRKLGLKEPDPVQEDEPDTVYGYDAAVAKAKERFNQLVSEGVAPEDADKGVKVIPTHDDPLPKPISEESDMLNDVSSINEGPVHLDQDEMTDYTAITKSYSEDEPVSEDPRPELPQDEDEYRDAEGPVVKPWPEDKDGDWYPIAEDAYLWDNPWFDKVDANFVVETGELRGWGKKNTHTINKEEEELARRCMAAWEGRIDTDYDETLVMIETWFRNPEDEKDARVTIFAHDPNAAKADGEDEGD